jgi:hypothetical protein
MLRNYLFAAALAGPCALACAAPAADAPRPRLQIVVDDSFEGEVGRQLARQYTEKARWTVELVALGQVPPAKRDRLKGPFPLFLVVPAGGGFSSVHSGLNGSVTFLEREAAAVGKRE